MTIEEALAILDKLFLNKPLTDLQEMVFRQSWQGKTYAEIAESQGYDDDYIRDVGFRLWHTLSEALGEKVTKSNFQSVLRRYYQCQEDVQSSHKTTTQEDKFICPIIDSCPYLPQEQLLTKEGTPPFKDSTKLHQDWGFWVRWRKRKN